MSRTPKTVELDLESLIDVSIVLNRADETIRKSLTAPEHIENIWGPFVSDLNSPLPASGNGG